MVKRKAGLLGVLILALLSTSAFSNGWTTYRHDNRRSGATAEQIAADRLVESWVYRSTQPPAPAWFGPAKYDAYALVFGLRSMRNYDPVFHVTAADGRLYFGSSADDSVRCLDTKTGRSVWTYTTDGPVRIAPSISGDRVYFGSDDGNAYCLEAKSGQPVWRYSPSAERGDDQTRVLNHGRPIPLWPCRTGVAIEGDRAYFAAGMLPWKPHYFCAVDAKTGRPEGDRCYVNRIESATFEGAMVVGPKRIYVPQGRIAPTLFERAEGKSLGSLKGGGGCFSLLTEDAQFFHGPGNKTGWITGSNAQTKEKIATFGGGNVLVVRGDAAYLLTDTSIRAFDRKTQETKWVAPSEFPYELILAGKTLFAGGLDRVAAFDAQTGKLVWQAPVEGKAQGLAVADGRLFVSTSEGRIHCFAPGEKPVGPPIDSLVDGTDLKPIEPIKDPQLLGRWVFQAPHLEGMIVKDLTGRRDGTLQGLLKTRRVGRHGVVRFDGRNDMVSLGTVKSDQLDGLPRETFSAEAWVRLERTRYRGGIIGAFQDNGTFERGWVLGYWDDRFYLGLNAEGGPDRTTYLKASEPFALGRWYHVAATYDGKTMRLYVDGKLSADSDEQSGAIRYPDEVSYGIGVFHYKDENFKLQGKLHEAAVWGRKLDEKEIARHTQSRKLYEPPLPGFHPLEEKTTYEVASGPHLQFTDHEKAVVIWRTDRPTPSVVEILFQQRVGEEEKVLKRFEDLRPKTDHRMTIDGFRANRLYRYRLVGKQEDRELASESYECDAFFNFHRHAWPERPWPFDVEQKTVAAQAKKILDDSGMKKKGTCLLLGGEGGALAYELARQSELRLIVFDTDADRVFRTRRALLESGVYGHQIGVYPVESLEKIPTVGRLANLLIATGTPPAGMTRLLAPGGTAMVKKSAGLATLEKKELESLSQSETDQWICLKRPCEGGVWTHQYGLPDNSGCGGESLGEARGVDDLAVQWIGRPGPRAQADRNGRKPSPLAAGGRLFVQGLHRILAVDTNNGTIHWSLEIPEFERFNVPRDCSNWCADVKNVFAAIQGECWQIDAADGRVVRRHPVRSGPRKEWKYDWGYVARFGELLLGSAVKAGTSWTNFYGHSREGWYDLKTGVVTHPICSDNFFAVEPTSGKDRWTYTPQGVILNPTITAADGRIWFVESRHPKVREADERRIGAEALWADQHLVSLDAGTGKMLWSTPLKTIPGKVVFFLAHGSGRLVLVSSDTKYHVYAIDPDDGRILWNVDFPWLREHHGGHMSRPTISGDNLYVRPGFISLKTGKLHEAKIPMGGCGSYVATSNGSLIYRHSHVTIWDPVANKETALTRLRPGCWVSTIPACGALLSPEAGGGCSCGIWMETSIVLVPKEKPADPE